MMKATFATLKVDEGGEMMIWAKALKMLMWILIQWVDVGLIAMDLAELMKPWMVVGMKSSVVVVVVE